MSKYDGLNARSELEQQLAADLEAALGKRGFTVRHNGSPTNSAPGGVADIDVWDADLHFIVEATKSTKTAQDREMNAIADHLRSAKQANPGKQCYCIYVSPETPPRMLSGIRDWNNQREVEGAMDLRILPLSFENAELWLTRLRESERDLYPVSSFLPLFGEHVEFADDLRVRKLLLRHVFPTDDGLAAALREEEKTRDTKTLERLVKDLSKLENYMREKGVATGQDAIDALIYLVFLKLHEEKRERERETNRLRDQEAFQSFVANAVPREARERGRGIHHLFEIVKEEGTFLQSGMFTEGTTLPDSLTDGFVREKLLPVFGQYTFVGTGIDALGAVYEVLAQRANKDVRLGQFFTPEAVVRFMVEMADLRHDDEVLDPACGTGRFLIYAMREMLERVEASAEIRDKDAEKERVRKERLHGADIDERIAKIARMNMWVNGDGKTNIISGNGLVLHRPDVRGADRHDYDGYFDVVLANPPLGELNYQEVPFADAADDTPEALQRQVLETFRRSPVLPRRNLTESRADDIRKRLAGHQADLDEFEMARDVVEAMTLVGDDADLTGEERHKRSASRVAEREGNGKDMRKAYRSLQSRIKGKRRTVIDNEALLAELEASLLVGNEEDHEWEITGNNLKGGALFLAAIWHYLKDAARPDDPPEWRGGRMLVVLDEGILNTDSYAPVREFLRRHFYIKAVVSLTRDAFVPISRTTTKTSIVYAIKKTDPDARQREPVFFAHAERVGLDTKGNATHNDLDASDGVDGILGTYRAFEAAARAAYHGNEFRPERFEAPDLGDLPHQGRYFHKDGAEGGRLAFSVAPANLAERLGYLHYHPAHRTLLSTLRKAVETVPLAAVVREPVRRGTQPAYDDEGDRLVLKTVDIRDGWIDYDGARRVSDEFFEANPGAQIQRGDVLVTATGFGSMGKAAVYDRDESAVVDGHVAIVRTNTTYDPYFLASLFRSGVGAVQFDRWFSGSSGQIEMPSGDLERFEVPSPEAGGVPLADQRRIAEQIRAQESEARRLEAEAAERREAARQRFQALVLG